MTFQLQRFSPVTDLNKGASLSCSPVTGELFPLLCDCVWEILFSTVAVVTTTSKQTYEQPIRTHMHSCFNLWCMQDCVVVYVEYILLYVCVSTYLGIACRLFGTNLYSWIVVCCHGNWVTTHLVAYVMDHFMRLLRWHVSPSAACIHETHWSQV